VIREAFAAHGGDEVDAQGDSFLDVFGRAQDAAIDVDQPPGDRPSKHLPHDGAARGRFGLTTSEPAGLPGHVAPGERRRGDRGCNCEVDGDGEERS
jgi:hypothetical protein